MWEFEILNYNSRLSDLNGLLVTVKEKLVKGKERAYVMYEMNVPVEQWQHVLRAGGVLFVASVCAAVSGQESCTSGRTSRAHVMPAFAQPRAAGLVYCRAGTPEPEEGQTG